MIDLRLGDCLDILPTLEGNSIDAVVTDPPYPKEYIYLFENLSRESKRLLKRYGVLASYSGQSYMPQVLSGLSKHLEYRWCIALLHSNSQFVWGKRANAMWKPIFILQNGEVKRDLPILRDVMRPRGSDKRYHEWGQNVYEAVELINNFSNEGDTILDPFMGGGTTGVACILTDRNFIGIEIEPEYYETAERRIKEAQMQLRLPI